MHHSPDYEARVTRATLARYLGVDPETVAVHHRLSLDLGLDAFDLALITAMLEEELDVELAEGGLPADATVVEVADLLARALATRRRDEGPPSRWRFGGRPPSRAVARF